MTALRYFDIGLVLISAPVILAAGLPALGYAFGAGGWVVARVGSVLLEQRVRRGGDPRALTGVAIAGMMGRVWVVVLAVVAARVAGGRDDGVMAAVLVLAAFTVYFALTLLLRQLEKKPAGS